MYIYLAMRARTGHSSADHREVRTAHSLLRPYLWVRPFFFFFSFLILESSLRWMATV